MSNIVKINISTISVCKRGDIKDVISKNDKKNPYNNVNTKINELLEKSSQNNYDDIKNGILLAIKTVQENLNHEGTKYFFQENYYGELGQNGIDAFNTLTSGDNLRDLEKICYHRKSYNIFNSDIKYSFYKTNYTDTAIKLRNELDGIIALYKKRIIINQSIESKGSAVFNPKNLSNSINEIKNSNGVKVLVVLTDGQDNSSKSKWKSSGRATLSVYLYATAKSFRQYKSTSRKTTKVLPRTPHYIALALPYTCECKATA